MTITKQTAKRLAIASVILAAGAGAAYAAFTSNTVSLTGNKITTGNAAIKLCDVDGENGWTTSVNPSLNLTGLLPEEERNLLGDRQIFIGNDNTALTGNFTDARCSQYLETAALSDAPLKVTPNLIFTNETCPDPLQSNIKIRFEIDGIDTGYKTLNSWATNATSFGNTLLPGQVQQVKAFTQLSSTTTTQNSQCDFTINLTGKQPTA